MTPSRVTPSTLQSAFHRQMPLRRPLAQAATEPSPSSRRFRLRVGSRLPSSPPGTAFRSPLSQSPYRPSRTAALSRGQGVSPTWTEQGCLLSTSAISTVLEHDSGSDHDPARPVGGCPPAWRCCGQRSPCGERLAEQFGLRGRRAPLGVVGASRRARRGELRPKPDSARTPHVAHPCLR